jgi:hypothetical protein
MERHFPGKRPSFRPARGGNNFYRVILLISLILAGVWVLMGIERGQIISPLLPTPTPTRMAESYFMEAQAYFEAGRLDDPSNETPEAPAVNDAIEAYQAALQTSGERPDLGRAGAHPDLLLQHAAQRPGEAARWKRPCNPRPRIELAPDDSTVRHPPSSGLVRLHAAHERGAPGGASGRSRA